MFALEKPLPSLLFPAGLPQMGSLSPKISPKILDETLEFVIVGFQPCTVDLWKHRGYVVVSFWRMGQSDLFLHVFLPEVIAR